MAACSNLLLGPQVHAIRADQGMPARYPRFPQGKIRDGDAENADQSRDLDVGASHRACNGGLNDMPPAVAKHGRRRLPEGWAPGSAATPNGGVVVPTIRTSVAQSSSTAPTMPSSAATYSKVLHSSFPIPRSPSSRVFGAPRVKGLFYSGDPRSAGEAESLAPACLTRSFARRQRRGRLVDEIDGGTFADALGEVEGIPV